MDREKAKLALNHLIEKYKSNKHLKDFTSNEKQISRSLIEPFVRDVLGWDIEDPSEFKVEVPASGKRVDILVCINGVTQFVIEAKSITQDIVDSTEFYKQTISYAHSKEKTFAILTNFKHFVILRCDVEVDNPLKAAVKTINTESSKDEDFDLLYNFSRQTWVEKKEENPLYLKLANYRRRVKVDIQLLEDLKSWRQSIINNIKNHPRHNKFDFSDEKKKYEVEEEVQRFIDRLIFICYTEDKGFIDSGLKPLLETKKDKYFESPQWLLAKIRELFNKYWGEYNSDLFRHGLCDDFFVEDLILVRMLADLRRPKDRLPYDFASIEADILGKTYENFIGHVLTGEKRLKEKESKGKRKEMGIYYTPTYIVDYIVRNTVGEYIKGKSFASINKARILDPACGSGSFLIKSFDVLVEESRNILKRELTYEERKNLMLNCIYGVDLDERAVDICKLNLSLKLAERGQKLPELHDNIKCGNSLIDDKEVAGYKAFKWEDEFKEIIDNGGFDVVVGNPPYGAEIEEFKNFFDKIYETNLGKINSYRLFIERSINLLKNLGYLGFIVPNTWLSGNDSSLLRKYILTKTKILRLLVLPESLRIFEGVTQATTVIVSQKDDKRSNIQENKVICMDNVTSKGNFEQFITGRIKQKTFSDINEYKILTRESIINIIKKIKSKGDKRLQDFFNINQGEVNLTVYKKLLRNDKVPNSRILIRGSNIGRYALDLSQNKKERFVVFEKLKRDDSNKNRIILQEVSNMGQKRRLKATYLDIVANLGHTCNYLYSIKELKSDKDILYFLSLLNSKILDFYFKTFSNTNHISGKELRQLPIVIGDGISYKSIVNLSDKMLSLNKKLQEIGDKNTLEKQKIHEEINKTDNEIDELVYQLYGITEEEKKVIEESLK